MPTSVCPTRIAALFKVSRRRQSKCPATDKWSKRMWNSHEKCDSPHLKEKCLPMHSSKDGTRQHPDQWDKPAQSPLRSLPWGLLFSAWPYLGSLIPISSTWGMTRSSWQNHRFNSLSQDKNLFNKHLEFLPDLKSQSMNIPWKTPSYSPRFR